MPWYLYLALKQLFPTGRRLPFFTFMSALGVAVGVMMLIVATSIMSGFGQGIRGMIVDTQGEIQVVARGGVIDDAPALVERLEKIPGIAGASASARGFVALIFQNKPVYPEIRGVDLNRVGKVMPLDRYMVQGSLAELDNDSVILSYQLARALGARAGDEVDLYSPLIFERMDKNEVVLPRTVRIAGIFEIGHQHLDRQLVIAPLRLMQDLYGLGKTTHAINVRLKPGVDEFKLAAEINRQLPPGRVAITWFEAEADFQSIIKLEKYMVFFLLIFIVIVAALSIMSSLLISVVRKTREIGLIAALGGKPRHIAACFCVQGFVLGVAGTIAGLVLAWLVITFRNDIVSVLARLTVSEEVFQQFYGFARLPSHTETFDVTITVVGTLISATLAGLLPAWRAARLKPVEALRSE